MPQTDTVSYGVKGNSKTAGLFLMLVVLPGLLGAVDIPVAAGFRLHFFPLAVFLAAALLGPAGSALSGFAGSLYAAYALDNPYLMIGNALLGFGAGYFLRRGFPMLPAVWLAFAVQLPWLLLTDYYFVHLPPAVIGKLVLALLISHTLWAVAVSHLVQPVKKLLS